MNKIFSINNCDGKIKVYFLGIKLTINLKPRHKNKIRYYKRYVNSLIKFNMGDDNDFVPVITEPFIPSEQTPKLITFYLPQFHTIPLNDENYGKGFTEWTNVTKAIPQYIEHYQPKLPIDMGFYDLSDVDVMKRQVELAKLYGIYGFCFHYYWFSGNRLLEKPIFNYLNNKDLNLPFCLCWANENWSKLWDGGDKEVIQEQTLLDGDDERFFHDILPFLQDERYIKIGNKPVLIVYRPLLFSGERISFFSNKIRELAKRHGFDDLYLITSNFEQISKPENIGFDAVVEFPPHQMLKQGLKYKKIDGFLNPMFGGSIWDLEDYIINKKYLYSTEYRLFKTVFPAWDNTARKAYSNANIFYGASPELYKSWLNTCIEYTKQNNGNDEQMIFINAWNEWGEGAYLEPDSKYGYAFLQATKEVLEENS